MCGRSEGVQDQVVTTDLDTLAIALCVQFDDRLKESPQPAPGQGQAAERSVTGRRRRLTFETAGGV